MWMKNIHVLKHLALLGAIHEYVITSSSELAKALNISQQSASKHILRLIKEGLIIRELTARKQRIKLTEKGMDLLRREHVDYQRIFEFPKHFAIHGVVTTGFGEGRYYLTQKKYMDQFEKKLWFKPFEGTLNLKLSGSELSKLNLLRNTGGMLIKGFESEGRTFGDVECFLATMQNVECAIVIPQRSPYRDVIEIISKYHLRRTLGLNDGDVVEVVVSL